MISQSIIYDLSELEEREFAARIVVAIALRFWRREREEQQEKAEE